MLQRLAHRLQLFYRRLKARALSPDAALRVLYDLRGYAQPLGYRKGVRLARYAYQQPVGGPECRHVELAGGVDHALRRRRVYLELRVVRRRSDDAAPFPRVLDDRYGQSRALRRVRSGAQLIEKNERIRATFIKYAHYVRHVRGKR